MSERSTHARRENFAAISIRDCGFYLRGVIGEWLDALLRGHMGPTPRPLIAEARASVPERHSDARRRPLPSSCVAGGAVGHKACTSANDDSDNDDLGAA